MKNIYLSILLICMSIATVFATEPIKEGNMISGHAVIKGSEENIPFATAMIVSYNDGAVPQTLRTTGATANEEGQFSFRNLPAGKYRIKVQALGFSTVEKNIDVNKDFTAVVHFPLVEEGFMTDEVVVSANRNAVSRREAPVVVNVLNAKLFETINSNDLSKTLNYQSGLRVENNCQNCGFPQVRINGLEGPYSQILINSRPVISALSGVYGLEQIPVNMIERVEVVRGGGSALFGANAVGGTINIITKDPINNSFQVASTMSNFNGKSWEQYVGGNVSLVSKDNSYGIAMYESYRNRNAYDADSDGFSELGKLNMNTFGMRAYYRPNHNSRINVEYHTTNEFRRGGNKFDLEPHEADIAEQTRHIINSGGMSYDQYWREGKHKMSLYGSVQHTDRRSYYGAQMNPDAYGMTDDLTWVTGGMYVGQMDKCLFAPATFTGGLEYQKNSLHDVMLGYKRDMKQDVGIFGTFVQNEWRMHKFSMLAGVRMDKHSLIEKPIFSPRVNFLYKPLKDLQARLTYSTGFRAPQAYDEDLHIAAVGGEAMMVRMAENLREERSNSFSGSVDWTVPMGHWQANLLVEGFYTDLRHVFALTNIGEDENGVIIQERRNAHGARVFGANFDAKLAHGNNFMFQAGFTAQRSRYTKDVVWREATEEGDPELTTRRMPRTPDYYGYFTMTAMPTKKFDFSLSGIYTGKMIVPHMAGYIEDDRMENTPNFFELNLKLNYTFTLNDHLKLQLNGGIQNITNAFQKDLDKGEFRDSGYFYGPTQPRTYFIGFKLSN